MKKSSPLIDVIGTVEVRLGLRMREPVTTIGAGSSLVATSLGDTVPPALGAGGGACGSVATLEVVVGDGGSAGAGVWAEAGSDTMSMAASDADRALVEVSRIRIA